MYGYGWNQKGAGSVMGGIRGGPSGMGMGGGGGSKFGFTDDHN